MGFADTPEGAQIAASTVARMQALVETHQGPATPEAVVAEYATPGLRENFAQVLATALSHYAQHASQLASAHFRRCVLGSAVTAFNKGSAEVRLWEGVFGTHEGKVGTSTLITSWQLTYESGTWRVNHVGEEGIEKYTPEIEESLFRTSPKATYCINF